MSPNDLHGPCAVKTWAFKERKKDCITVHKVVQACMKMECVLKNVLKAKCLTSKTCILNEHPKNKRTKRHVISSAVDVGHLYWWCDLLESQAGLGLWLFFIRPGIFQGDSRFIFYIQQKDISIKLCSPIWHNPADAVNWGFCLIHWLK